MPILLFAALAAILVIQISRDTIERRFVATARVLMAAVDSYVLEELSSARLLADLAGRNRNDGEDPASGVRRFAAARGAGSWLAAVISSADGTAHTVTFETVPGVAAALVDRKAIEIAAAEEAPMLEPMVEAQGDAVPVAFLPLRIPIVSDRRVSGVLSIALAPTVIAQLTHRQQVSPDVLVTVFDPSLRVVGRAVPSASVGHRALLSVQQRGLDTGANDGLALATTIADQDYLGAFETSPVTGWAVAVGASRASILGELERTALWVYAGAIAFVLSVVGAFATGSRFGRRIVARERALSAAVRTSEARYRAVVDASQQLVWVCSADGKMEEDSPTWRAYTGQNLAEMGEFGWLDAVHREDREPTLERWRANRSDDYEAEYRLFHRASGRYRWVLARARPLRGEDSRIVGWIGMSIDIDARKSTEERQRLLMREMDHRAKNALTVAQAVVQMTRADDIDGFVAAVVGRIAALIRTHALLASNDWQGTAVRRLVEATLKPFYGDRDGERERIRIAGPEVAVAPECVQPLAMLLHELATNAAKYGSLSRRSGSVSVAWTVISARGLRLTWREGGGPPVTPPERAGFGTQLVRSLAQRQLDGMIRFGWHPRGLRCALEFPAACISRPAPRRAEAAAPINAAKTIDRSGGGFRVLMRPTTNKSPTLT
ncbi:MAG: HWE histidine kinase domain-containing protein [Rhodospirillales bacterium]